jgi:hypothetical protein
VVGEPVAGFLERLDSVETRLKVHADRGPYEGLTDPDAATGEQWDCGQVWAHLALILPYMIGELRHVVGSPDPDPVDYGHPSPHADRIAAIENGRHEPIPDQMGRVSAEIAALRGVVAGLPPEAWNRQGRNRETGQILSVQGLVDRQMIGRLEADAVRLDAMGPRG